MASGIILSATLAAPVAGAALTAQQSSQKITVDGKLVQIEAYSIGGNNYCKLRDVGKAVGFAVEYDPMTNTVCRALVRRCRSGAAAPRRRFAGSSPHPLPAELITN